MHGNRSQERRLRIHLLLWRTRLWLLTKGGLYLPPLSRRITSGEPYTGEPSITTKAHGHGNRTASMPKWRDGLPNGKAVFQTTTAGVVSFLRGINTKARIWYVVCLRCLPLRGCC